MREIPLIVIERFLSEALGLYVEGPWLAVSARGKSQVQYGLALRVRPEGARVFWPFDWNGDAMPDVRDAIGAVMGFVP